MQGRLTFPEAQQPQDLDTLFRQMQARDEQIRQGDHRGILNLEEGVFSNMGRGAKSAITAGFLALATPVLKAAGESVRDVGLNFISTLGGKLGFKEQVDAVEQVLEFDATGKTQSEGLDALLQANPEGLQNLAMNFRRLESSRGVLPKKRSFFANIDPMGVLAPAMSEDQKAGTMITNQKDPVPNIGKNEDRFNNYEDYLDDQERLRREGFDRVPQYVGALDTDATAYNAETRAQQQEYEKASLEKNRSKRDELINIINAANTFNENAILEDIPDEFLYNLQEQRMLVNQRPVPSYSQAVNRMNGVYEQVTVSALYV